MTWQEKLIELKKQGYTWREIAQILEDEYDQQFTQGSVRGWYRRNAYKVTPESVIENYGMDPSRWQIVTYRSNKDKSRVTVKPIGQSLSLDEIDTYFAKKKTNGKITVLSSQYNPDGEILEICIPDLHSGLFSWRLETGEDYDVKIATERFNYCLSDILARCKNRKFKKILFVTLGDLMHIDNDRQETTKGTQQQADGRIAKIFSETLDMLINAITLIGEIAPVEVIYLVGNHDSVSGYMVLRAVEMAFRKNGNIVFDTLPNPQKFRLFGNVLIGWTHGDMNRKYLGKWLMVTARKEYGQSKFAEVHVGHNHTLKNKEIPFIESCDEGIIVRHLPNISSASHWEHRQGYLPTLKTALSFVWNENNGLREIWYSTI